MKKQVINFQIFLGLAFCSQLAFSDILFVDMNYSINEVEAIRNIARDRNEKLILLPNRSQANETLMAKQWRLVAEIESQQINCFGNYNPVKCKDIDKKLKQATDLMDQLTSTITRLDGKEFEKNIADISHNQNISLVVFSGHSGNGSFSGLFGSLLFQDIKAAFEKHPDVLKNTNTILLWGCYSGTLNLLYNIWQKSFPSIKLIAGYGGVSPLGIRPQSAKFLTSLLLSESKLLSATSLAQAHKIFKSIDLVATLDGTAILRDYYLSYAEAASIQDMLKRCDQFPEDLYKKYQCYDKAEIGCENPPADHHGPIREFYSYIQTNSHCIDLIKEKYPDIPTKEYLIRLIYIDNIKSNFRDHNLNEITSFSKKLSEAGLSQDYSAENYLSQSRAQNIALNNLFQNTLLSLGYKDYSFSVTPSAPTLLIVDYSQELFKAALNMNSAYATSSIPPCVPFSWVDLGAKEKDSCAFGNYLADPQTISQRYEIDAINSIDQILYEETRISPYLRWISESVNPIQTKLELKNLTLKTISMKKVFLESQIKYLSPFSKELLSLIPAMLTEVESMLEDQLVQNMLQSIDDIVKFSLEIKSKIDPNNIEAKNQIEYILNSMVTWQKTLKSLN